MKYKYKMGAKVIDKITGFEGIITGAASYLTGCNQYLLQPPAKDGEFKEGLWFDENRIGTIREMFVKKSIKGEKPGGPQFNAAPIK